MNFGIQSILWGESKSLGDMLREISAIGYAGVELFQHPDQVGGSKRVFDLFHEHRLILLGVTSGSFAQKLAFVRDYALRLGLPLRDVRVPYVYLDEWREPQADRALQEGFRLAIHPHMFREIQTLKEAERIFAKYPFPSFPNLLFMPDTAHMAIAGDNAFAAIASQLHRIEAIHINDWQSNVGRSYQFYARGFCELGKGRIDLKRLLSRISPANNTWLIVEQANSASPVATATQSLAWLKATLPISRVL